MIALLILMGGAFGAVLRYVLDTAVKKRAGKAFPWGTLTVNVLGAGILGALHGASVGTDSEALLGTGFCGALTTFSTFELDTVHLFQDGRFLRGAVNVVASLGLGLLAFTLLHALFRWV
ncbi:camphor resistance protein CrcB [Actinocorallia herbida]|uniref:Fluoride-specific ion channel FluC n=1 Tax=Actinocorallia herbida TaxID=58109 RepID=A0A3N1CXS6_9ACTN|nr:fluoride efflux transporter CrcB [Actinocorallia herbida]ROO85528.1 camphor resistance protein CrcB [Actinocorallia herbida]